MDRQTKRIKKKYNRVSRIYDVLQKPMDKMVFKNVRHEIMDALTGRVLEVGVGTGKNIKHYPDNLDITAIDISEKMLVKARKKAVKWNKKVRLELMDAQKMSFDDGSFDCVFATCVLCSIPDPVKGLEEIKRVCKQGGKIILIEHVRSEQKIIGLLMDLFNPMVAAFCGTNINRKTLDNIKEVGFYNVKVEEIWKDIVKKITIYK